MLPSIACRPQGLLRTAIKSDNPTVFMTHTKLMTVPARCRTAISPFRSARPQVARMGGNVTVVATSYMVQEALKAAETLAQDGIEAEVVDPRTIVPLDRATHLRFGAQDQAARHR